MKLEQNMLRLPAIGLNFDCISKRKGLKKQLNYIWVSILQVKSGYTPSSKYKWKYDIQELNIWGEWRSGVEEVGCWSYGVEEEGGGRGGSSGSDCPAYPHTGVLYGQLLILTQGLAPPSSCSTQATRLRCTQHHRRIFDLKWWTNYTTLWTLQPLLVASFRRKKREKNKRATGNGLGKHPSLWPWVGLGLAWVGGYLEPVGLDQCTTRPTMARPHFPWPQLPALGLPTSSQAPSWTRRSKERTLPQDLTHRGTATEKGVLKLDDLRANRHEIITKMLS